MSAAEPELLQLACRVARAGHDAGQGVRLVALEVSAPDRPTERRPPLDLVLAVDRSSSMLGTRIAAAVEACRQIALRLGERDRLGVVAFDAVARLVRPPGPVGPSTAAELAVALAGLGVGYGTNVSAGWERAAELISKGGVPQASRSVLLLTDGLPSRGLMEPKELVELAASGFAHGIATTTVGIGEHFDEELLARMAKAGGGAFRFVQHDQDTARVADEEVEGLTALVAEEAVLHLGFARAVGRYEVLHDLPCRPEGDGTAVDLGRVFAGRPRAVVVEVRCQPEALHLGAVGLSCLSVSGQSCELEPVRMLLPGPGQDRAEAEWVGRHYVPLRVAEWQRRIWERGRDPDPSRLRLLMGEALEAVAALPEELVVSEEAQEAVLRLRSVCERIREILDDRSADQASKKSRTEHTLKGLAEHSSITLSGTKIGPPGRGGPGWGRK